MAFPKNKVPLRFTIIIRNNKTDKHKSIRFDDESIKSEKQLLDLIKKQLENYYNKK